MLEERFRDAKDSRDEGHWYSLKGKNLLFDSSCNLPISMKAGRYCTHNSVGKSKDLKKAASSRQRRVSNV